jgi:ABC-type iron transport system FetAB ATPase subunit
VSVLTVEALQVRQVMLDVRIGSAEIVCLAGPSGSGKSLLLRAIADLIPHQGRVRLDDLACEAIPAHEWRRKVGLLPAESQWWRDRVGDHFTNPEPEWFERLGFSMAVLDWELARCSTGEKQRLAILRLLSLRPQALLLDEPTASLDPASIDRVESLLRDYAREYSVPVIWVTHDSEQQQRLCQRRLQIHGDRVEEVER